MLNLTPVIFISPKIGKNSDCDKLKENRKTELSNKKNLLILERRRYIFRRIPGAVLYII